MATSVVSSRARSARWARRVSVLVVVLAFGGWSGVASADHGEMSSEGSAKSAKSGPAGKGARAGSIVIREVWARTSPMEAKHGAVYMVLRNVAKKDNALVRASVPRSVAMDVELHETKMGSGGTMAMHEVEEIVLPAKATTRLEPGGYHVMLMDLAKPLVVGERIAVQLGFAKGPKVTVKAVVRQ